MRTLHLSFFALLVGIAFAGCNSVTRMMMSTDDPPPGQTGLRLSDLAPGALSVVVEDLVVPWDIAFLPDGTFLVSERPGRITHFPAWEPDDGPLAPPDGQVWNVPDVLAQGEGGLMGLALHPDYELDPFVYAMFTADGLGGTENRIERFRLTPAGPEDRSVVIDGIPGNRFHDGGRIAFGSDGYLYITTGDAGDSRLSQDPSSLAGKILRLDYEGGVPPTNPFGSAIWSMGHRNPEGLTWDDAGRLWSTEHGRSGLRSGFDELNLIQPGENYGWPTIEGDAETDQLRAPVEHSGADYTWAPAGIAWIDGRLFFGGLRGEALYEATIVGAEISRLSAHFVSGLGRIRAVVAGPDGMLYLSTSNRDGRGSTRDGDDKILRLDPAALP